MPPLTADQLATLQSMQLRVESKIAASPALSQQLGFIGTYLVNSESQLIALMNGTAPPSGGDIEFGMVLYWIHNDLPSILQWMAKYFPPTQITAALYAQWQNTWATTGVIAPDGTMVADGPFSQLDKGWFYSSILYVLKLFGEVTTATQGPAPQPITLPNNPTLTIALLGDWGTGPWSDCGSPAPAVTIMQQLESLSPPPDIVIHVGDVYYSGAGHLPWAVTIAMMALSLKTGVPFYPNEEDLRLVQQWWSTGPKPMPRSFTLNSNHESYSGSNGYFGDALTSSLFTSQGKTSYFALYYQDWAIVGLDSALYSTSIFNMQGALQNSADSSQVAWAKGLNLTGKNVIALTHHTALSIDGQPIPGSLLSSDGNPIPPNKLYSDMHAALNNQDPDYWYWGHTHNGVVYNTNATMSSSGKTTTLCRCLGHAAIPFGDAYYWQNGTKYSLGQSPTVDYYAHSAVPNPTGCAQQTLRVKNGFAVITLAQGTITESFYEQGNTTPVWTSGMVSLATKAMK